MEGNGNLRFGILAALMVASIAVQFTQVETTCGASSVTLREIPSEGVFHAICETDLECMEFCDQDDADCDGGPYPLVQS